MTQDEIKLLCKWAVQNSKHQLSQLDKETIKHAIDGSETINDLFMIAITVAMADVQVNNY